MSRIVLSVALAAGLLAGQASFSAELSVEKNDRGVTVKIDGKLFTEYLTKSGAKPVLWPVIGPTGKPVTRAYPLEVVPTEEHDRDHVHQRSLWFTHGLVNGIDFWSEEANHGTIEHREFVKVAGGEQAVIATRNDWLGPDKTRQCEDLRTITLGVDGASRWIDFDIVLTASDGPVTFGDTKEGCFGIRVASSIRVDANLGGKIINSQGQTNDAAWGQRAGWVDYSGPVDGQVLGIAVLNHPTSYGYPTPWHVRTYGLFAANPFGLKAFTGQGDGSHRIEKGKTLALRYRVLLHEGDATAARVAEAFAAYEKPPKK